MARQYNSSRRSSKQSGGVPQQFLIVIVTFFLGYITASIFDVQTVSHWVSSQVAEHAQGKKVATKAEVRHAQVPPKPKFEFYTLLANEKVPGNSSNHPRQSNANSTPNRPATHASASSSASQAASNAARTYAEAKSNVLNTQKTTANTKPESPNSALTPRGIYRIQVASFKARQDAEHMKGMLILKGFNANVVPVAQGARGVWFRVMVGPYSNRLLAQKAQETLARNERLKGMITGANG